MKLSEARLALRLSIEELASKAGVTASTIRNIEKGVSQPRRMEVIRGIEQALGINGQIIDEFRPVLGEPTIRYFREMTPERLVASLASVDAANPEQAISREEFHRRIGRPLETPELV